MRPDGSPQTVERRRRRALALLEQGLSLSEVARRLHASVGSVYQGRQAWQTGGEAALAPKPGPGRPCKLTAEPRQQVLQLIRQGARAHGFPHALGTVRRLAAVIQVHLGVRYPPAHIWKIWRRLGWSGQVPERQPIQRDASAIAPWKRDTWPAIQKSPPPGRAPRLPG